MPTGHFSLDALEKELLKTHRNGRHARHQDDLLSAHRAARPAEGRRRLARASASASPRSAKRRRRPASGSAGTTTISNSRSSPTARCRCRPFSTPRPTSPGRCDIAWIVRGGGDPFDWIKRYASRITAVHVKDIAPPGKNADEDGWADVGHGTIDWAKLIAELRKSGDDEMFIMEHDNPNDYRALRLAFDRRGQELLRTSHGKETGRRRHRLRQHLGSLFDAGAAVQGHRDARLRRHQYRRRPRRGPRNSACAP